MEFIKKYRGYSICYMTISHVKQKTIMVVIDDSLNLLFIAPTDKYQFHQVRECEEFIERKIN